MMIVWLKILVIVAFLLVLWFLCQAATHGRTVATTSGLNRGYPQRLAEHKNAANWVFWITLAAVVLTETLVRFQGGVQNKFLFGIHLCFAAPFLISLSLLRWKLDGLRHKRLHKPLAYLCCVAFAGTLTTGIALLFF